MNEKEAKKEENNTKTEKDINNNTNDTNNTNISEKYLLPPKTEDKIYLKTLVLDLDETLAHGQNIPFSSPKNQIKLECNLNNIKTTIFFKIRPGVREFMRKMSKLYEIVIFTASVEEYAKSLINLIDIKKVCSHKLFRDQCTFEKLSYIKDLKKLGRDLKDVIIVDNSPNAFSLNKENGIPISTWIDDENDRELFDLIQILEFLSNVDDVRVFIPKFVIGDEISYFASLDIIRKYQNLNFKSNNMSAINFHPYMNNSEISSNQITEVNNYSINIENPINREEIIEDNEEKKQMNDELDKKEKDLIDTPENLFDDIILNDNINKTDFDININGDLNLLTNEKEENKVDNKNDINSDKNDIKINKDKKNINSDEINNSKEKKENSIIKKNKEKINTNAKDENKTRKNISMKNIKNQKKSKVKTLQKKNNIKKIKHNKSSSYSINHTISNFDLLMPNHKSKKENISKNKNEMNSTMKNIKSKTVKRPKKITLENKSKKMFYRPRNIITEFKPLKTLNNSVNGNIKNKNNLNLISYTPKKVKNDDKNKLKNRILKQKKKKKEKSKEKIKEEIKLNKSIKEQNNNNSEINKKELIKKKKKNAI